MNKIYNSILFALAMSLVACGGKDTPVDPTPVGPGEGDVEVVISTSSIETKAASLTFKSNDKMNIFAKTYNRADAPNIVDDVVATFDGSNWSMTPKVYINANKQPNAFVYAAAPYDPTYIDAKNLPVDLTKQVDLMYSGAFVPASTTSPKIKLTMKHALSLLSFNIVPVNYSGQGVLTSLALEGEAVYQKATLDVSTGKVTLTEKGKFDQKFNKALQNGGWTSDIPGLWVLPLNTKAGYAKLTAVIDGKTYEALLPEVEAGQGWQYIFRLALTNNGLEFDPSKTETISLNVNEDKAPEFGAFGSITLTADGAWLNSPILTGDAIFGTLVAPGANSAYNSSVKVEGLKSGDKVILESWNSTGFELGDIENISVIDITEYE